MSTLYLKLVEFIFEDCITTLIKTIQFYNLRRSRFEFYELTEETHSKITIDL